MYNGMAQAYPLKGKQIEQGQTAPIAKTKKISVLNSRNFAFLN